MAVMVGCTPPGPLSEGEGTPPPVGHPLSEGEGLPRPAATLNPPDPLSKGEGLAHEALEGIDSLMWEQADSALKVMMEFAASPEADSLNEFEGHYCQVLIAELLFKNDYGQSNRWRRGHIILMVWDIMSATASLRLARNISMPCG